MAASDIYMARRAISTDSSIPYLSFKTTLARRFIAGEPSSASSANNTSGLLFRLSKCCFSHSSNALGPYMTPSAFFFSNASSILFRVWISKSVFLQSSFPIIETSRLTLTASHSSCAMGLFSMSLHQRLKDGVGGVLVELDVDLGPHVIREVVELTTGGDGHEERGGFLVHGDLRQGYGIR